MDLHQLWVNVTSDPTTVLILSPFALLVLGVIVYSIVFLWRLRHYPLEKAREMATGARDGMIFFTGY